ncbi:TonB-dependent receptor [Chitinophaga sp. OAE865]|uniref:SusC/RagA family TonB-linked outer membrane protein n=1 Tax=Chitinophaga sp. OAE865 TaxID=2817898 RepID=UPI001AE16782
MCFTNLDYTFRARKPHRRSKSGIILFVLVFFAMLSAKAAVVDTLITGHVLDPENKPLPGASVSIKSTPTKGVKTAVDGSYSISAAATDILVVSFIGYGRQEVPVNGRREIEIVLQSQSTSLESVVVVGYGTQKKGEVTGAISSVNENDLKDQAAASLQQSLQGKSAGIQITQNSGSPGKNATVRVRGLTSINNSDVLYVVDGVPLTANGINAIDPSSIASVQILKDASSQAIYGSRGANGVVLIETKKGNRNASHIYVDAYAGVQQARKKLDMLNGQDFIMLNSEAFKNAGQTSPWTNPSQYTINTDWQDAMFRSAPVQSYNLAFAGGSDKLTYRLSGNYFDQDGIIIGSSYKRSSFSLNTTFKPNKYIEAGENLSIAKSKQYLVGEGATSRVDLLSAISMDPTVPLKNEQGNYVPSRFSDIMNPLASIEYISMNHPLNTWSVVGSTYLLLKPVKGLSLKSNLGIDLSFSDDKAFTPTYYVSAAQNNPITSLSQTKATGLSWTWDNTATYETTIAEDHELKVLAGISAQQYSYEFIRGSNQGQPGNDSYLQYLDAGTSNPTVGGTLVRWSLLSYLGRLNYNYKQKYFLTATIRRDGSSKFGANNKYGNFPSASVGWALGKENFLSNRGQLSALMLRASWGIVGNQSSAGYYDFSSTINNYNYAFGNGAFLTAEPAGLGNPNLKWEQVRQWDLGLDFKVFEGLTGTIDYYNKKTNNMLLRIPILFESGFSTGPLTNVAAMANSGFEFQLDYSHHFNKDLRINIGANLSTLHNEVLSLENEGAQIFNSPNMTRAGHRVAEFYGYVFDGIFQNQAEISNHAAQPNAVPGDIRFKDLNNDKVINDLDQTFLGSPIPNIQYGFNVGANYKGFDLNLAFFGVSGNKIYQSYKYNTNGFFISNYNMEQETLGRWHGEGTSTTIPRLTANDRNFNSRASSYYLTNGAYLRLRNITLGYNLPDKLMERWHLSGMRVFLTGQNLITFTHYDGYDPEIGITFGGNAGTLNLGQDQVNYPQPKTIMAGINLTL